MSECKYFDLDHHCRPIKEVESLRAKLKIYEEAIASVIKFWHSHEAWGDFASLTSAAGAFAPVAKKCILTLDEGRKLDGGTQP